MELKSPSYAMCARFLLLIVFLLAGSDVFALDSGAAAKIEYSMERADVLSYPPPLSAYERADGVCATLLSRIREQPFNLFVSAVFILAILHTFAHRYFVKLSEKLKLRLREHLGRGESISESRRDFSFFMSGLFHMLGEVELIFGFWLVPLFIGFWACFGWQDLGAYLNSLMFDQRKFVEPVFVIVVMCMAGTRPVIHASAGFVGLFSKAIGGGVASWWIAILCIGPLLGSFVTEPAAITICASLLGARFYSLNPSKKFCYATLGLLLAAVSAGGTLTHFSAPPVLMVVKAWEWDMAFMFENFGWKAALGIFASVGAYFIIFRKELKRMGTLGKAHISPESGRHIPISIVVVHLCFLTFAVICLHQPVLFLVAFFFFLGFMELTKKYQYDGMGLKSPILVGMFLSALVIHGGLQAWWIEPVLMAMGANSLFGISVFLTAFNDNAAITYLASLVPDFSDSMKYMVVAGAVAGGGLTVIANAPNPAGIAVLKRFFKGGVSPLWLFLGAALPTAIISACLFFL